NWLPALAGGTIGPYVWYGIAAVFTGLVLAAFLLEMAQFRSPGESIDRVARTVWIVAYLGLLPCFLIQLRWLPDPTASQPGRRATTALALMVFAPKCADIGAYFTGRSLGRHPMAPVLSPKKTWEG